MRTDINKLHSGEVEVVVVKRMSQKTCPVKVQKCSGGEAVILTSNSA